MTMRAPAFVDSPWFRCVSQLLVGGVFIYASLHKISDPAAFAENIRNYHMMPYAATNLMAIVLPWVELFVGVFLITGFRLRGSALVASSLLVMFVLAIGQAAARGISLHCGCFSAKGDASSLGEMFLHMAGNAALAVFGFLLLRPKPASPCCESAGTAEFPGT
jgi:uncharacterized membrane protein YphA (DoxX/SURF4 family)